MPPTVPVRDPAARAHPRVETRCGTGEEAGAGNLPAGACGEARGRAGRRGGPPPHPASRSRPRTTSSAPPSPPTCRKTATTSGPPGSCEAPGGEHDDDLYPRPMSPGAALESIRSGIGRATVQPISTRAAGSARTQVGTLPRNRQSFGSSFGRCLSFSYLQGPHASPHDFGAMGQPAYHTVPPDCNVWNGRANAEALEPLLLRRTPSGDGRGNTRATARYERRLCGDYRPRCARRVLCDAVSSDLLGRAAVLQGASAWLYRAQSDHSPRVEATESAPDLVLRRMRFARRLARALGRAELS